MNYERFVKENRRLLEQFEKEYELAKEQGRLEEMISFSLPFFKRLYDDIANCPNKIDDKLLDELAKLQDDIYKFINKLEGFK